MGRGAVKVKHGVQSRRGRAPHIRQPLKRCRVKKVHVRETEAQGPAALLAFGQLVRVCAAQLSLTVTDWGT